MPYALTRGATWLAVLGAALAVSIPWYLIVQKIENVSPVESAAVPTSVVWADRTFVARPALAHWLHVRGVAYSVWAGRHPVAATRIKRH